jgi:hypothetical protein
MQKKRRNDPIVVLVLDLGNELPQAAQIEDEDENDWGT